MASTTSKKSYRTVSLCEVCSGPLRLLDFVHRYWVATCTECGVIHEGPL